MRYPVDSWSSWKRGYTFGVPTNYSPFHLGTDLAMPVGTPIYAPTDGVVTTMVGTQGGNTIHLKTPTHLVRFLHLSSFKVTGQVKEGQLIGLSGNTGLSTGPHLHTDISKGSLDLNNYSNFIDPEIFFKPSTMKFEILQAKGSERVYVVRNNKKLWLRREPILTMFADFSDIKQVTPEFLASIPDLVPGIDNALEIMANK